MIEPILSFQGANIAIGVKQIFSDLSWQIKQGDHVLITGQNGSGKTVLAKAIAGRLRITKGSVQLNHIDYQDIQLISFTDDGKLFHSVNNVHYYQQRFNAWDSDGFMTARGYLLAKGVDVDKKENQDFLHLIGLKELLDLERIKLSSGQTRKLLLASALLRYPKLLIIDNPYIGLDKKSRAIFNEFLDQLVLKREITLILTGQFTSLPECIKKVITIQNGKLVEAPRKSKNQQHDLSKEQSLFLKNLQEFQFNNDPQSFRGTAIPNVKENHIEFRKTNIGYGGNIVIANFNWTVKSGERWLLTGGNGSGKSSLFSMIYGDHPQIYSQQVFLFNARFGAGRSIWEVKKKIGFTSPELHAYFRTDLTAEEIVWTGLFDKFEIMGKVTELSRQYSTLLFEYYGLKKIMKTAFQELSTGHQRICLLLRALIKQPIILLLDEPFQGLDQQNIELSKELINEIIQPEQSLVFISHLDFESPACINHFKSLEY